MGLTKPHPAIAGWSTPTLLELLVSPPPLGHAKADELTERHSARALNLVSLKHKQYEYMCKC